MKPRPVVVTRPGEPGAQLTRDLNAAGLTALWLPAFTLGPPPDENRVAGVLAQLANYQLAIFVSVPAVEATAKRLPAAWPATTAIAVVGAGTRRAVLEHIPSAAQATWFVPPQSAQGDGGSEALWNVLRPALSDADRGIHRALVLRAQHGREWLGEQLSAAGIEVENLAVYVREATVSAAQGAGQVQPGGADLRRAVVVVTSSEAVDAFLAQFRGDDRQTLLRSARVLAPHERIVARARAAGFADIRLTPLDIDAIRQAAFAQ